MVQGIKELFTKQRIERLIAFGIDIVIILIIIGISFKLTGAPNYMQVKHEMDAINYEMAIGVDVSGQINTVIELFNTAFISTLWIYFIYEIITQIIFRGATVGKKILGLKLVAINTRRNGIVNQLLMVIRTGVKLVLIYLFQGFPFIIAAIYIFADDTCRTSYDRLVKMKVVKSHRVGEERV